MQSHLLFLGNVRYSLMLHFWRFLSIENLVGYSELFWRHIYINAPNTAWRYIDRSLQALQTLYWPLKFSESKEQWRALDGTCDFIHDVPRICWCYVVPRISGSIFQAFLRVKCNITVISLLFGKYTRTFVPRFPGIPEMLYFPPPSASGNITSRGFPGTSGQTFWYISLKAMKYLYNTYSW